MNAPEHLPDGCQSGQSQRPRGRGLSRRHTRRLCRRQNAPGHRLRLHGLVGETEAEQQRDERAHDLRLRGLDQCPQLLLVWHRRGGAPPILSAGLLRGVPFLLAQALPERPLLALGRQGPPVRGPRHAPPGSVAPPGRGRSSQSLAPRGGSRPAPRSDPPRGRDASRGPSGAPSGRAPTGRGHHHARCTRRGSRSTWPSAGTRPRGWSPSRRDRSKPPQGGFLTVSVWVGPAAADRTRSLTGTEAPPGDPP